MMLMNVICVLNSFILIELFMIKLIVLPKSAMINNQYFTISFLTIETISIERLIQLLSDEEREVASIDRLIHKRFIKKIIQFEVT